MGRILAVDPGVKRVGLALSDPLKMIASPYAIVEFKSCPDLVMRLKIIIAEKGVDSVVIGFPLREDGESGPGCDVARELAERLLQDGITTTLWDERYTTRMAESILRESGIKTRDMKDKKDMVAASLLLENYLRSI